MADMIIKMHLKEDVLQALVDAASHAGMSLSQLFECFINDINKEDTVIPYWLQTKMEDKEQNDESLDEVCTISLDSARQVHIQNLLESILGENA